MSTSTPGTPGTVRFRSTTPNLNVLVRGVPQGVAFKDHVFVTSDATVADALRQHISCGSEFTEETAAVQAEIAKVAAENGSGEEGDKPKDEDKGKGKGGKPGK